LSKPQNQITLSLPSGPLSVWVEKPEEHPEIFWMKQAEPEFGDIFPPESIAEAIGLSPVDLHPHFPVQIVSTGLPQFVVPVASPQALSNIAIQDEKFHELIEKAEAKIMLVFCGHGAEKNFDAAMRVFSKYYGVPEDPATGSGAGCLAGYLIKHNYYKTSSINIKVSQGRELNRPSLLHLRATQIGQRIQIDVGGSVIEVAEGDLISAL
jgi:trans-2,3-dihydro-3-hydroxyanthranilate isomerase